MSQLKVVDDGERPMFKLEEAVFLLLQRKTIFIRKEDAAQSMRLRLYSKAPQGYKLVSRTGERDGEAGIYLWFESRAKKNKSQARMGSASTFRK